MSVLGNNSTQSINAQVEEIFEAIFKPHFDKYGNKGLTKSQYAEGKISQLIFSPH